MSAVHVFERAGLGIAPFRFVGCYESRGPIITHVNGVECHVGAPGQPMGTCAYCGQGIAICCQILSADGRRFIVGYDCVRKTGDAGLKKAINRYVTNIRHLKEDAEIASGREWFEVECAAGRDFGDSPTGRSSFAEYFGWMMRNAGRAGKLKAIRQARKIAEVAK